MQPVLDCNQSIRMPNNNTLQKKQIILTSFKERNRKNRNIFYTSCWKKINEMEIYQKTDYG